MSCSVSVLELGYTLYFRCFANISLTAKLLTGKTISEMTFCVEWDV